jgi:hypothetical protein
MELERKVDDLLTPEIVSTASETFDLSGVWNLRHTYASNVAGEKPTWYTRRARGTLAALLAVVNGDNLNQFEVTGWSGTVYRTAARITSEVDGVPTAASVPGKIVLSTTKAGDTNPTNRMTIHNDGEIEIFFTTEDLAFVDAGSAGATEQDWIEVTVGNVQGYLRVFAAK